jgi:mannose-1-phosphate guanylyltransferase
MTVSRLWAVVLAGGSGERLRPLTRALYGYDLPKQFAAFDGSGSLLQQTVDRTAPLVPGHRTLVVVGRQHAALAREQLAGHPEVEIVSQPCNLDTGPGILLPLSMIRARDSMADVALFPSDHHIPRPDSFLAAVRAAAGAVTQAPERLYLLGARAETPETDYGWILPGAPMSVIPDAGLTLTVRRFVEKPHPEVARDLLARGALWNMFVSVGRIGTYWAAAQSSLPYHTSLYEDWAMSRPGLEQAWSLDTIYRNMEPANFSRSVLEKADNLAVVPVDDSGWSDLGVPERVLRALGVDVMRPMQSGKLNLAQWEPSGPVQHTCEATELQPLPSLSVAPTAPNA